MREKLDLKNIEVIDIEVLKKNKENIETELPQWRKNLAYHEELLALNQGRLELAKKMNAISDVENEPLSPQYAFQKNKEWVALQSQLLQLNSAAERKKIAEEIEQLEKKVASIHEEIHRLEDALPLIVAELKKRGE